MICQVFDALKTFSPSEKELSDVGKDLPTRVGESEANRDKNRYPYILPCECRLMAPQVIVHIGA